MEEFVRYQSLKRYGTEEVEGINLGTCYIFPKLDGTNASLWLGSDGEIKAGSRNRELARGNDNAGFLATLKEDPRIKIFFKHYPHLRLYGEWLVPHSLKTYREEAWRKFYIFDVAEVGENGELVYRHYETYKEILEQFDLDYIPAICVANNATYEQLVHQTKHSVFLIKNGAGAGEGIVIKNYNFVNRFGRTVWAKIVTNEFKELHSKEMGGHEVNGAKMVEEEIAGKYVTLALCEKTKAKIELEMEGWNSRYIPRLLNTVFYDLVNEDSWSFVKEHKFPKVDFKTLQHFTNKRIKEHLPEVF